MCIFDVVNFVASFNVKNVQILFSKDAETVYKYIKQGRVNMLVS